MQTVTVRYESGSEQAIDVPEAGTQARELFDDHVAKGRYVIIDGDVPGAVAPQIDTQVPTGNISAVVAWVDNDRDRAAAALIVELERPTPRASLVGLLERIVEGVES